MIAQINRHYIKLGFLAVYRRLLSYFVFEGRPLTTKGRWINSFVFFGFRIFNLFPVLNSKISPVFLVGIGRSGTTILGKLLSAHSKIGYLNEPKAIWHYSFGNEDLVGSYASPETEAFVRPELSNNVKGKARLKKVYAWYQKLAGTPVVIDKYPELIFRVDELIKIFPEAKFIAISRNGHAVAESIHEWSEKHHDHSESANWWGRNDRKWNILVNDILSNKERLHLKPLLEAEISEKERGIVEWWYTMSELLYCVKKHNKRFHLVRHEDLCEEPEREIDGILSYLGLSKESKMMTFVDHEISSSQRYPKTTKVPNLLKDEFNMIQSAFDYETD
ncbi:sulfotransferase family protein [Ekhidna sp.]